MTTDLFVNNVALSDVPERKQDLVNGRYELPAPPIGSTVAVKIINLLREWANRHGLTIEYPPLGWIVEQVSVNRSQLLQFLEGHGHGESKSAVAIRARIQERGEEGFVYRISADEY